MKYAIITDIHGNSIALEAVIRAVDESGGVNGWWVLGDNLAIGADPVGVLELLDTLPEAKFVKGNTDHYILNNWKDYPPPYIEESLNDAEKIRVIAEISRSFAWTQGMITASGWWDWNAGMPVEIGITLPCNKRVLLSHAHAGAYDGWGITPVESDETVARHFNREEDIFFVGHTHYPQERQVNGKHIINPGAVGNPVSNEIVARYVILESDESSFEVTFHKASYDVDAVIEQIYHVNHPTPEYLAHFYRGEFVPDWYRKWQNSGIVNPE